MFNLSGFALRENHGGNFKLTNATPVSVGF
jgi:hypothetical protein